VNLWVVVPAYNEAARIAGTLAALRAQTDTDFTLLVVDNGSTDDTAAIARAAGASVLSEPEKGVGCAVDTGFRHAIAHGATHIARTDADCLPRPGWITGVRAGFAGGGELLCGRITARRDEHGPIGRAVFRGLVGAAATFGRWRPAHRSAGYRAPYRMHAGNNMAVTAALYQACGGMPRQPSPTDRLFLNRVRMTTDAIVHRRDMVVENSTRRIRAYGVLGTARWYLDRGSGPLTADPR
jgi:glycosyltransferase involved in cell wall biosynthesis